MAIIKPSINLLKKKESFFEKFIAWALSYGRFIIILTEGIALIAFLYRFSLDRQLIDLHDQIEKKQAVLRLLKKNEDTYRNLQDRLTLAEQLETTGIKTTQAFIDVLNFAPIDFTIKTLTFSTDSLRIDADSRSLLSVSTFIKNLQSYPEIKSVSLNNIENKTSSAVISVSITALLKNQ